MNKNDLQLALEIARQNARVITQDAARQVKSGSMEIGDYLSLQKKHLQKISEIRQKLLISEIL